MKKITLDNLKKYVITPNVGFYGGYIHTGEDIDLCNDHDEDEGYGFKVRQKIINNVLITDISRVMEMNNGKKIIEASHMEIELEEGQLIVYVEGTGFTIPEYKMCTIDEAIETYKVLK
ncbi:MAG: hypothetical protein ACI4LK_02350 [Lentihominibacter sp.]